ncbi:MAG: hypothetical protein IE937_03210, partial [Gammaproteobacteria bacterium]|nr:hypothetical protein [Gammaproteobacteria bacterium]
MQAVVTRPVCFSDRPLSAKAVDLSKLHQFNAERYPFLLESVAKGALGQYSILLAFPQKTLQLTHPDEALRFIKEAKHAFEAAKIPQVD